MNRTSLVLLGLLSIAALPKAGRAADPADPFAPPPEAKEPSSTEDEEAAVLGAPARPNPGAENPPPPPAPPPARRPPTAARRQANDEERSAAATSPPGPSDQSAFAIELSTSGFASGSLAGGLFAGARTANGLILGGILDYGLTSLNAPGSGGAPDVTTSMQFFRIGAGARQSFLQSADHLVDLYGAADVTFESRSAEVLGGDTTPTTKLSASGFSLAAGPGLRLWVHSQIAIGYAARFRLTYLSGSEGALAPSSSGATDNVSSTQIGFEGTFQILGVF